MPETDHQETGPATLSGEKAQQELLAFAGVADSLIAGLESLIARLPVSPQEALMLLGEADLDAATEIRRVVECMLEDRLRPVARELRRLASDQPEAS